MIGVPMSRRSTSSPLWRSTISPSAKIVHEPRTAQRFPGTAASCAGAAIEFEGNLETGGSLGAFGELMGKGG